LVIQEYERQGVIDPMPEPFPPVDDADPFDPDEDE
jgi:hypothetical protein